MVATTPSMFITDQYGKLPDMHGDGALTINEAVRMSKLINKLAPAFTGMDNRIVEGFEIEKVELVEGTGGKMNLKVSVGPGTGIIGKNLFKVPLRTELSWDDFYAYVPSGVSKGKILIFFEYND